MKPHLSFQCPCLSLGIHFHAHPYRLSIESSHGLHVHRIDTCEKFFSLVYLMALKLNFSRIEILISYSTVWQLLEEGILA